MKHSIQKTADLIKKGEIVIFPTETVYGLGASINYPDTIKKIFEIKVREKDKPLQILVSNFNQIKTLAKDISKNAEDFIEKHMPGPITILLNKSSEVPSLITAGSSKVGIRIPDHELTLQLIEECGPLVATSANISGKEPASTAAEAQNCFPELHVLNGGKCKYKEASTVIDLATSPFKVIRKGPVEVKI